MNEYHVPKFQVHSKELLQNKNGNLFILIQDIHNLPVDYINHIILLAIQILCNFDEVSSLALLR